MPDLTKHADPAEPARQGVEGWLRWAEPTSPHRTDPQPGAPDEFPVVTLPLTPAQTVEHDGRVPGVAGPASMPPETLVPPRPLHGRHSR